MPLLTIDDLLNGPRNELDELLAKAADLSNIYEQFVEEDKGDGHKRAPGIHASEVSGCERRVVYSLRGEAKQEKTGNIWKRRFKIGHVIHDMFQRDFMKMSRKLSHQISFEPEIPIAPELQQVNAAKWQIYSHCDGIFTIRETWNGPAVARVVLEIKSASPDEFEKLKAPKPDHIEQAHVYMACLDVPVTWFLYYNKGNQNYTPSTNPSFFVQYDPKIWANLEQRFERVHTAAATNVLPERQEGVLCEFCPYSWSCQPQYLARKAGFHKPTHRWSKTP